MALPLFALSSRQLRRVGVGVGVGSVRARNRSLTSVPACLACLAEEVSAVTVGVKNVDIPSLSLDMPVAVFESGLLPDKLEELVAGLFLHVL